MEVWIWMNWVCGGLFCMYPCLCVYRERGDLYCIVYILYIVSRNINGGKKYSRLVGGFFYLEKRKKKNGGGERKINCIS